VQRWEYMTWAVGQQSSAGWVVIYVDGGDAGTWRRPLPEALSGAGSAGWELAGIHPFDDEHKAMYVFKRPKAEA